MACVNPDGSISEMALALLRALQIPQGAAEIASASGKPLFRVRSSLREVCEAGLVEEKDGKYSITDKGKALI